MKSTTQLFAQMDTKLPAQSRTNVMRGYCRKYLPSLTARIGGYLEAFIEGRVSYEQILFIIGGCEIDMDMKILDAMRRYDREDARIYGPRSLAPFPPRVLANPVKREKALFIEAFGPTKFTDTSRVRGTMQTTQERTQSIGAW